MVVCGIISEFNPFHNGHRALIESARENGADGVVCVMSGNFVQRGSLAITEKRVRTQAAILNGADLVLELPVSSAMSTAQRFARGAVHILNATGCIDMLAFGSEAGEAEPLKTLASAIDEPRVTRVMRGFLKRGLTFAKARELAVAEIYGETLAAMLSQPNNVLAVEYLRESNLQGFQAQPFTMRRIGAEHHSAKSAGGFASASYLRANIEDFALLAEHVPESAAAVYAGAMSGGLFPAQDGRLDIAVLSHLRRLGVSDLAELPDISEGLENRFYAAIRESMDLDSLAFAVKTKRYTMARIRRLILSAFLGLTAKDCDTLPPYIRVLGFNSRGRDILSVVKKRSRLPLASSLAVLRSKGGVCERFAYLEELSTDLYGLSLPSPLPCGYEYTGAGVFPPRSYL